ncbi:hypothetical protein ACFL6C_05470 [Myxococcota bacterium]
MGKKRETATAETLGTPEVREQRDENEQVDYVDEFAFDEMNLVELPFCLLEKTDGGKRLVPLSPTKTEYLEAGKKRGLPTALAMRAVLGLLWLTKDKNNFTGRIVRFSLRELVEEYMFPGRFTQYRAAGKLLKSVEDQLHRVAATRLYTKRWYDRRLNKHTEMDASVIDYMQVINQGGRNSARTVEVAWGTKVFQSVQAKYTRSFDVVTWLQITHPLDQALFRWLSRQLECKDVQEVASIQKFGRYKLLMQGRVIEKGGRTASSYVLHKLQEALERLNGLGFPVRMTADQNRADFSLRFERIGGQGNEVVVTDQAADLVAEFKRVCHGVTKKQTRGRVRERDRKAAREWLEAYGLEQATWMVKRCHDLHRTGPRSNQRLMWFSGLQAYEVAAAADYEHRGNERGGRTKETAEDKRYELWERYRDVVLDSMHSQDPRLRPKARRRAKRNPDNAFAFDNGNGTAIEGAVNAELAQLKLEAANAITKEEFIELTDDEVRAEVQRRHGEAVGASLD